MTWQQLFGHSVIYGVRTGWWAWHAVVTLESAWKLEEGDGSLFSRTFKLKASVYAFHCRSTIFWYQIHWINPGPQWSKTLIWADYLLVSIFNFLSDIILQYNHYCCVALAHMLPHEACQVRGCLASRWFQLLLDMLAFFFLLVHLAYLHMALFAILHMALHETCQARACFSSLWLLLTCLVLNFDPLCIIHCNTLQPAWLRAFAI